MLNYTILTIAVLLASGAQVLIKSRLTNHGEFPANLTRGAGYVLRLLFDPMILAAGAALIAAAVSWYFVVSRIPIGIAFAFAALSYPVVLIGACVFLREAVSPLQIAGNILIVAGIILIAVSGRGV